jgi:hypothetical protein
MPTLTSSTGQRIRLLIIQKPSQEDGALIYDSVHSPWALDGRPTPGATKFEFDIDQRDMELKEPPGPEQVYDFSLLDELAKR